MTYEVTGILKGRRYRYQTSDYAIALQVFINNNLKSLWEINKNGKRNLIQRTYIDEGSAQ